MIDLHTHVYPPNIARKAAQSIRDFYDIDTRVLDGTAATLLQQGSAGGIDRFVLLPVAVRPENVRHINRFILEEAAREPRFLGFGALHAAMEDPAAQAEWILSQPLYGLKLHPDIQGFPIDDPRLFPVYDRFRGRRPILFHMGDRRLDLSHPARLRRVLELFPDLQVVAAHFGGYEMYETAFQELGSTHCYLDLSSSLMFMAPGQAEDYIRRYGPERVAFGTDYPLWDPAAEARRFRSLRLTDRELEQVGEKTALAILGLEK